MLTTLDRQFPNIHRSRLPFGAPPPPPMPASQLPNIPYRAVSQITVDYSCPLVPFFMQPTSKMNQSELIAGRACVASVPLRVPFVPFQQAPSIRRYRVGQFCGKVSMSDTHCRVSSQAMLMLDWAGWGWALIAVSSIVQPVCSHVVQYFAKPPSPFAQATIL
jgi:hypothetical protein